MRFVLTNDDGIDAPGIRALKQAVGSNGVVVAPQQHLSGCGHQVTTTRAIQVEQRADGEFAIAGTPADCTRIALSHLFPDAEWVISGINAGGNLGADVYISGTVAAVREAAFHRVPGIAISHYIHQRQPIDWGLAGTLAMRVIDKLLHLPLEPGAFWNVNLPHLQPGSSEPDIVFCPLCTQPLPIDYRVEGEYFQYVGNYGGRSRDPGSDVDVCFSGSISISKIRL
ncbi:MAG TPA: 5'/3'-nucleotidase SurE [Crinalium sp.]|jgi:5'-nucleotidase